MNGTLPDLSLTIPLVVGVVLALLILGTLVRFGSMASMRRMGMSLAIGAALFWGMFAIAMLWGFWDSYYQYFYDDRARKFGRSKYGISRTFKVFLDLITVRFMLGYANRPIHVFGALT